MMIALGVTGVLWLLVTVYGLGYHSGWYHATRVDSTYIEVNKK